MFNATEVVVESFVDQLTQAYEHNYGSLESSYGKILAWAGRMALERIAQTDAFYHTVSHTISVTLVGQAILRGKHMREGGVTPSDWLNFMISLLCHDIGYVRGICQSDYDRRCTTGIGDEMVTMPPGATDAFLTPYHIDRGKLFVRERFGGHDLIDAEAIARNIELTRFPVPDESDRRATNDYPALLRAADLVGQLADPNHLQKLPALYMEFEETGTNERLGFKSHEDLRRDYPNFFWNNVTPYIGDGLRHLAVTQEGRQYVASLHAQVFTIEHE